MTGGNSFNAKDELHVDGKRYTYFSLPKAETAGLTGASKLPYCLQVLLENARNVVPRSYKVSIVFDTKVCPEDPYLEVARMGWVYPPRPIQDTVLGTVTM